MREFVCQAVRRARECGLCLSVRGLKRLPIRFGDRITDVLDDHRYLSSLAGRESRCLVKFANLTLAVAGNLEELLGPVDRLCFRLGLQQREAADDFLCFGKGAVGHREIPTSDPDPCASRTVLATLGGQEYAGFGHLLDELSHRGYVLR